MDFLGLFLALILLVVPGLQLAALVVPPGVDGRPALVAGYGLLAGLVGIPLLIRLVDFLGLPVSFVFMAGAVSISIVVLLAIRLSMARRPVAQSRGALGSSTMDSWEKLLVILLLGLIALRLITLGTELIFRPLFPWDATMHWATKARVWYEHKELVPFVENAQWLQSAAGDIYTDYHPSYPITIPLLQLWISSALGQWDESLMNIPWLICYAGLGFSFYGQSRQAGLGVALSLTFTYGVLSLPLLNTHVALAGYADLFLAAAYCLAVMAFYNWSVKRQIWQAVLALGLALSGALLKNEGLIWLLTFIPALVVVLLSRRLATSLLVTMLAASVLTLLFFPPDVEVGGHSLGQLDLHYRPGALSPVFESLFIHGSWHLFIYLLLGLVVLGPWLSQSELPRYSGVGTVLASAVALFLSLFIFTRFAGGDGASAAVGRISLQLVPSFMFICALFCNELISKRVIEGEVEGIYK